MHPRSSLAGRQGAAAAAWLRGGERQQQLGSEAGRSNHRLSASGSNRLARVAVGGTTLDTHGRPHGLRPQGRPSPQDEALRGTILLGAFRKTWERYPEDVTRYVRLRVIP